ncbi:MULTISPECIES: hypothetical protein [unclassified Mesorhizobium]|uniref:hypothetical protein n=1 Tax=unclassified Mesorhizobium TaxID=325217 RepID=UPI00301CAA9E
MTRTFGVIVSAWACGVALKSAATAASDEAAGNIFSIMRDSLVRWRSAAFSTATMGEIIFPGKKTLSRAPIVCGLPGQLKSDAEGREKALAARITIENRAR